MQEHVIFTHLKVMGHDSETKVKSAWKIKFYNFSFQGSPVQG